MRKTKKIMRVGTTALICGLMLLLFGQSIFAQELSGLGTAQSPYVITSVEQLLALGEKESVGYVRLDADLRLTAADGKDKTCLIPKLTGTLDGNGHTISNLTLKGGSGSYSYSDGTTYVNTGLVGELSGTVKNLKITDFFVSDGIGKYNNIGAVAGRVTESASAVIENCVVTGSVTYSGNESNVSVGGLVGLTYGMVDEAAALSVQKTVSRVSLQGPGSSGSHYGGGVLGYAQGYSALTVEKCAILGDVKGMGYNGGVIGYINQPASASLSVSDSYLGGTVSGSKAYGLAYNGTYREIKTLSVENFHYDQTRNPNPSSYSQFMMLSKGSLSSDKVIANTTEEITKPLLIDGFEVRESEFGKYPIPIWSSSVTDTPTPTYEDAIEIKDGKAVVTAAAAGSYTLVFAAYDKEGQLQSAAVLNPTLKVGVNTPIAPPDTFVSSKAAKVRVLYLQASTMRPMALAAEKTYTVQQDQ